MKIVILGAGISGLSLGWFLKQCYGDKVSLEILEKSPQAGGWVQSMRQEDFLFELGPRTCRTRGSGTATLQLIEQLGLQERLITADPAAHRRYLWHKGRLQSLPSSPFSWQALKLIPALTRELFISPAHQEESVYDFFARRFGPVIADTFVAPMMLGIYTGDAKELSLSACFPKLYAWEQQEGSVLKGALKARRKHSPTESAFIQNVQKSALFSFREGLQELVHCLKERLQLHLHLNCTAQQLKPHATGMIVELDNGSKIQADHVLSTLPPKTIRPLLQESIPEASKILKETPSRSVAVACLGYRRALLPKKGFGYLIPPSEKEKILGVVFDSTIFPLQNAHKEETRLTVMIGGEHCLHVKELSKEECYAIATEGLKRQLGLTQPPDTFFVQIAADAIPQYTLGHTERTERLREILRKNAPRLTIHGNGFDGIAFNDCIANSKAFVEGFSLPPRVL